MRLPYDILYTLHQDDNGWRCGLEHYDNGNGTVQGVSHLYGTGDNPTDAVESLHNQMAGRGVWSLLEGFDDKFWSDQMAVIDQIMEATKPLERVDV